VNGILKQLATKPGKWIFILQNKKKEKVIQKYGNIFLVHYFKLYSEMDGIMNDQMVKRYPCRDYKCLLVAQALPMTKDSL